MFIYFSLVPPDISDQMTVSDVTVREGENATLTCKAVGHPQPRIVWKREDGENIMLRKSTSTRDISLGEYITYKCVFYAFQLSLSILCVNRPQTNI